MSDFIFDKVARSQRDHFCLLTVFLTFQLVLICLVEAFTIGKSNMMEN